MWGICAPLYLSIVWAIHNAVETGATLPLAVFCMSVFGIISGFGGTAATRPALTGDMFGTKNVGILTARQLSVVMPAAFIGPKIVTYLRHDSLTTAMKELVTHIEDKDFVAAFGAGKDQLGAYFTMVSTSPSLLYGVLVVFYLFIYLYILFLLLGVTI